MGCDVFRITRSICLGPFASPARQRGLIAAGITHLLNVSEAPSVLAARAGGFREVVSYPIVDLERIPDDTAANCLDTLHRMVCEPDSQVYVHCVAGWNRSPTVVWLYLVACGLPPEEAKTTVEQGAPDAIPGHPKLVDAALVETVRRLGSCSFLPHPRPQAIEPA
jgi:Swiss Army Knife protein, DSP-PTPase phosphatase domain